MADVLTKIASYGSSNGAEIAAFDPGSDRLFVVAGTVVEVLDLSNLPANPTKLADLALNTTGLPTGYELVPNSVTVGKAGTVSEGIVAVALAVRGDLNNQELGQVQFFNAADGSYINTVTVGYLPDMVTFTPDGTQLLTANEGEPNESYTEDPEGSVSIIDISGGVANATVTTLDFNAYDAQRATLQAQGVKLFGEIYDDNGAFFRNSTVSEDLEPEYVAISPDGTKAYVTLQENNAVAVIDIASKTIDGIQPLGFKDYNRGLPELTTYDITNRGNINNGGADLLTADGNTIELGGFSGLFYDGVAGNGNLKFLTLPDRGPNGDPTGNDRPFLLPDYQARIVSLELNQTTGEVTITDQLLLTRQDGTTPITGLPNIPNVDERAVDAQGNPVDLTFLDSAADGSDYDPFGADLEGIVRAGDGTYWAVDEYRPAIYHFDTDGSLIDRFIPVGTVDQANTANPGANYAADAFGTETLPTELLTRRSNRGFEGMALDTDNGILYAFIQTPLANPNNATSGASNVIRMIGIDPTNGQPVAEYVYLLQKPEIGNNVDKIGDATYAGNGKFYVMERDSSTDSTAQKFIFEVNLTGATNILGLDLGTETLEQQTADDLAALGITPVNKVKVTNLPSLGYLPTDKSEGLTVLPDGSLAVINDNDFGVVPGLDAVQLGIINFSGSNGLDASDRDGGINITNQPVFGVYQPDSIAAYTVNGQTYYITANEGDARNRPSDDDILVDFPGEGDIFSEEARIKDLTLDPTAFPNAAELQADAVIGRLNVTTKLGDIDGDGDYDQLFAYGGRSFSIWDSNGNLVFDSGDQLEQITATNYPNFFNASNSNNTFDNRSDDKGPEPEGVTVGKIGARTYAFIGLERVGGVMVYDVTVPTAPTFVQYLNDRDFTANPE
ncbi:MAG: choice-of-anchor I domain-containing protein, partial [Prochlorotrichaceae cyanobacterium]